MFQPSPIFFGLWQPTNGLPRRQCRARGGRAQPGASASAASAVPRLVTGGNGREIPGLFLTLVNIGISQVSETGFHLERTSKNTINNQRWSFRQRFDTQPHS